MVSVAATSSVPLVVGAANWTQEPVRESRAGQLMPMGAVALGSPSKSSSVRKPPLATAWPHLPSVQDMGLHRPSSGPL